MKRARYFSARVGLFPAFTHTLNIRPFNPHPTPPTKHTTHNTKQQVIVSVDRLDVCKGLPQKLMAFDALLENYPEWRGQVRGAVGATYAHVFVRVRTCMASCTHGIHRPTHPPMITHKPDRW